MTCLKLILYELKKLFSVKYVKIILLAFISVNLVFCSQNAQKRAITKDYAKYLELTIEKYKQDPEEFERYYDYLLESNNKTAATICPTGEYLDTSLYIGVHSYCHANEEYHRTLRSIISSTVSIKNNYEYAGNTDSYLYRYQLDVLERYQSLQESIVIEPVVTRTWETYFQYDGEFLFLALFLIVAVIAIMLGDRQNGFYAIESTCKNGRKKTFVSKFCALMIVSALAAVLFTVSSLIAVLSSSYACSPFIAVQSVEALRLVPYNITIAEFILLFIGIKAVSACIFSAFVCVFCILIKNYIFGFVAGLGVIGVNYYISMLDAFQFKQWKYLSLWFTFDAEETLSRFRSVDVFGYSVDLMTIFSLAAVLILDIGLAVCVLFHHSRNYRGRERFDFYAFAQKRIDKIRSILSNVSLKKKKKEYRGVTSVFAFELVKNKFILISLAVLLIAKVITSSAYFTDTENTYERIYRTYISEIEGVYTDQKAKYIDKALSEYRNTISRMSYMEERYYDGKISDEEFNEFMIEYSTASAAINPLSDIRSWGQYLQRLYKYEGIEGSYFYEDDFLHYTSKGVDLLLLAFVAMLGCNAYVKEYGKTSSRGSVSQILSVTKKGRMYTFGVKLAIVMAFSALAWILFEGVDMFFFLQRFELPSLDYVLVSSQSYKNAPIFFTLGNYLVIKEILSFFGTLCIGALCFALSQLMRDFTLVFTWATACLLIPNVIYNAGATVGGYVDITMAYNVDGLLRFSLGLSTEKPMLWFVIFMSSVTMLAIAGGLVAARRIIRGGNV